MINEFKVWDGKKMYDDKEFYVTVTFFSNRWKAKLIPKRPRQTVVEVSSFQLDKKLLAFSGWVTGEGKKIFEDDVIEVITQDENPMKAICKYGMVLRRMGTGWEVQIPGFYLEREDGFKSYPIFNNFEEKNDLEKMKVLGNVNENPRLWAEEKTKYS